MIADIADIGKTQDGTPGQMNVIAARPCLRFKTKASHNMGLRDLRESVIAVWGAWLSDDGDVGDDGDPAIPHDFQHMCPSLPSGII